ncbi:hypothetical protein MTP03_48010 [Tsukamurella sp. PLM1]|nr:hypothetical protein MTP03_48010 [Tsukamurella sp. PLM1]
MYWEVAPDGETLTDTEFDKEAWLSMLMLEWGSCGQVAIDHTADGMARVVGTAFYAPPRSVPRAGHFPTAPVSPDAVLLTWVGTAPGAENRVKEELVTAVCTDLVRRGVRAVEAFGLLTPVGMTTESVVAQLNCGPCGCETVPLTDADFLEGMGFETVAPHHRFRGCGWNCPRAWAGRPVWSTRWSSSSPRVPPKRPSGTRWRARETLRHPWVRPGARRSASARSRRSPRARAARRMCRCQWVGRSPPAGTGA